MQNDPAVYILKTTPQVLRQKNLAYLSLRGA